RPPPPGQPGLTPTPGRKEKTPPSRKGRRLFRVHRRVRIQNIENNPMHSRINPGWLLSHRSRLGTRWSVITAQPDCIRLALGARLAFLPLQELLVERRVVL